MADLPVPNALAPGGDYVASQEASNALTKSRLANTMQEIKNAFQPQASQAEIDQSRSVTNKNNTMTPLEAQNKELENKWYERKAQADINYKNMGGGRGSTGSKDEYAYHTAVAQINPHLKTEDQIIEAADAYDRGEDHISGGIKLNEMTPYVQRAHDRAYRSTTTAPLIKAGVQANQADAELKALNGHVSPVIKDIGTTYFNKSPDQLMASFSNDEAAQKKLGRIIGARSLQYAIAQLRNRIDMGEAGINATQELMHNSGQTIDSLFPRVTPLARAEADRFIQEGVDKALTARNKYGVGASGAAGKNTKTESSKKSEKKHYTPEQMRHLSDDELAEVLNG